MEEFAWQTIDPDGRTVRLSARQYQEHILARHPEAENYLEAAKETVGSPDLMLDVDNGSFYYYKAGLGRGKFSRCYVLVIVRYHGVAEGGQQGDVPTFFLTTKVVDGRQIWPR